MSEHSIKLELAHYYERHGYGHIVALRKAVQRFKEFSSAGR